MLSHGKDFNMSLVVSMGYCIEVVGDEGQGEEDALSHNEVKKIFF